MFRAYRRGAVIIGVVGATGGFLIETIRQKKQQRHSFMNDIKKQNEQVSRLQHEIEKLREQQREINGLLQTMPKRRRLRLKSSTISTSTNDYTSALEQDSSDLEFYDLSSDEDSDSEQKTDEELKKLDYKLKDESSKVELTLERLLEISNKSPDNSEVLWRIAKAYKILANQTSDIVSKQNYIMKGVTAGEKAIELKPEMAICHKWLAILVGMQSEFLSTKERIENGFRFKKHIDIAISFTPDDPFLHHMLGRFAFELAQLSWIEKTLAQALFAELPNMTHQDALDCFLKAEKLSEKDWKENKLFIAKCSIAVGKTDSAIEWLNKAELSDSIEEDKVHEEVKNLLEKYNE